jgi:uncharacterized protein (DUF2147 family)
MKKTISSFFAAAILLAGTSVAFADQIEGNWKTQSGETAKIGKCGSSFCITLKTGKYAGQRIGKMKASSGKYVGTITDPADNKEYSGSATVSGTKMKMTGCALKIFCKTQKWNKL